MKDLINKIKTDGIALNEDVLKVDSFLNHQIDPVLMKNIGDEFAKHFKDLNITKVFTIESSGIAPALMTSLKLNIPLVVLKKQLPNTLIDGYYSVPVKSFTKNSIYNLTLSKKYISKDDNILIIDDFLAYGEATLGVINIIKEAHANIAGIGIVIEKSFQPGRKKLDSLGYNVYSLARIASMSKNKINFIKEE